MPHQLLFVYGTLKRGQSANHMLGQARFVRSATTAPRYRLLNLGDHPGLVDTVESGQAVHGELWLVDIAAIPALDAYEGAPTEYGRRPIAIAGCAEPVIAYFFLGDGSSLPVCGAEWPPAAGACK